ncbi:MAG: endonuclease/exonuclease/phosphatase family protein, partial [bacterium]
FGGGFVLFLALFFAHYAGYDLPIPGSRTALFLVAGAVLLVASLAGAPAGGAAPRFSWALTAILAAVAMLPLARPAIAPAFAPAFAKEKVPRSGSRPARDLDSGPIRVVTFNLHAGFDEAGGFALDEMLFALRREDPDVVALQEVSRGWVINGSADLYELAREVLGLEGVPGPSVVPDWGSAVFTRWPAKASRLEPLPPPDLPLPRSATLVDLGAIRVLATHFHHRRDDDHVREEQASFVAGELVAPSDTAPSILLGDFNALPESRCLAILADAGWRDVFDGSDGAADIDAGTGTYPSRAPVRRIDTIFFRGPWRLVRAEVAPPWGSDHRAVVAELLLEPRLERASLDGSGTSP